MWLKLSDLLLINHSFRTVLDLELLHEGSRCCMNSKTGSRKDLSPTWFLLSKIAHSEENWMQCFLKRICGLGYLSYELRCCVPFWSDWAQYLAPASDACCLLIWTLGRSVIVQVIEFLPQHCRYGLGE